MLRLTTIAFAVWVWASTMNKYNYKPLVAPRALPSPPEFEHTPALEFSNRTG